MIKAHLIQLASGPLQTVMSLTAAAVVIHNTTTNKTNNMHLLG